MSITGNGTAVTGLGGPAGYGEIQLDRGDDTSIRLDLGAVFTNGLNYFGVRYEPNMVFVNTNGALSFVSGLASYPTGDGLPGRDLIAAFWGDVDTRLDGEGAESGPVWVDIDPVADAVTVTWQDVGVYRRSAEVTNTFQVQLLDRGGGDFDIVFRYETIGWTGGSAIDDIGARAGLVSTRLDAPQWIAESAPDLLALPQTAGNTGVDGLWVWQMRDGLLGQPAGVSGLNLHGSAGNDLMTGTDLEDILFGMAGDDTLLGGALGDQLDGGDGNDFVSGEAGWDLILGGDGRDTLSGGPGNDTIRGGETQADLRDVIYGGDGDDSIDGGWGNDALYGGLGRDTIDGGFGADTLIGNEGDDELNGSVFADQIYGNDGNDFLNGGFGNDRLVGGAGTDTFYHTGIRGHGTDWIQDYSATEGDVLRFGADARWSDFQVNFGRTLAGADAAAEAFVIFRPTGQILWALVDGEALNHITLNISGIEHDLLS